MSSIRRDAFDRAIAAWKRGDLDSYLDLYDEDIQLFGYSPDPMGKQVVRGFYQGIWDTLSDLELEIHEVIEDDRQIGCRFTMHGNHTGELAGIAPTGRRVAQPGFTILTFAGDKVVHRHSVADFASVIAQISA